MGKATMIYFKDLRLLTWAKRYASNCNISLSEYISRLIEADKSGRGSSSVPDGDVTHQVFKDRINKSNIR